MPMSIWVRRLGRLLLLLAAVILGLVAGVAVFFAAAGPLNFLGAAGVWMLLALAAVAQALIMSGAAWLASRWLSVAQRRWFAGLFAAAGLVLGVVLVSLILRQPLDAPASVAQPRADTQFWDLPTGSRLAYSHFAAQGARRATPIIFLHGGPGSPLRGPDFDYYRQFSADGFAACQGFTGL